MGEQRHEGVSGGFSVMTVGHIDREATLAARVGRRAREAKGARQGAEGDSPIRVVERKHG
jgi:hypothetical protein